MNKSQVTEILRSLLSQIDELLLGIDEKENPETLAEKYRKLKSSLEAHSKGYNTVIGQKESSEYQMNFLFPAAQEACFELKVKSGSKPSPKMVDNLVSAQGQLEHYHHQLRT